MGSGVVCAFSFLFILFQRLQSLGFFISSLPCAYARPPKDFWGLSESYVCVITFPSAIFRSRTYSYSSTRPVVICQLFLYDTQASTPSLRLSFFLSLSLSLLCFIHISFVSRRICDVSVGDLVRLITPLCVPRSYNTPVRLPFFFLGW